MNLDEAPGWVWSVVVLCIMAAVGVLILTELNEGATWTNESIEASVIYNATAGIGNVTKQLPTLGIIVGVLLIVGAGILIAMYFGKRSDYT